MICHAVDGTKIRAVASRRTVEHRKELEKALGRVEASIAEMEAAVGAAEQEELTANSSSIIHFQRLTKLALSGIESHQGHACQLRLP